MKAYIGNVDWADEGNVFFFSIESEENLKAMKNLIETLVKLDLFFPIEIYWGTNESFDFTSEDLLDFIDSAKDVSEEELAVFKKFRVSGFDIYSKMLDKINDLIWDLEYVTQESLDRIKPFYIKLYSQDDWDDIQEHFND